MVRTRFIHSLAVLALASALPAVAGTDVIVQIDLGTPSAAAILPTAAFAAVDVAGLRADAGVTLVGFFDGNSEGVDTYSNCGALDALLEGGGGARLTMARVYVGGYAGAWTYDDLGIWEYGDPLEFSTSEIALTGSISYDLRGFGGLPSPGAMGNVVADFPNVGPVIGLWEVVSDGTLQGCAIFIDGFDSGSGDTCAWSTQVGSSDVCSPL